MSDIGLDIGIRITYVTPDGIGGELRTDLGDGHPDRVAVEELAINYGRPAGHLQPEPGDVKMALIMGEGVPPLPYWTRITVDLVASLEEWSRVTVCWVNTYDRRIRSDGQQYVTITALDPLGRVNAMRVGSEPWPEDYGMNTRLARINATVPDQLPPIDLSENAPDLFYFLAPRDIDSVSALEIAQASVPPILTLAESPSGQLRVYQRQGTRLDWAGYYLGETPARNTGPSEYTEPPNVADVPLNALEDPKRFISDRKGILTGVALEFALYVGQNPPIGPPIEGHTATGYDDKTVTFTESSAAAVKYSSSIARYKMDYTADPNNYARPWPELWKSWARAIADGNATSRERRPEQRVILPRVPLADALMLLDMGRRATALVSVGGQGGDLAQVISGTLTYKRGRAYLRVQLRDSAMIGMRPVQFDMIPASDKPIGGGQRLQDQGIVTIGQTGSVGNIDEWGTT